MDKQIVNVIIRVDTAFDADRDTDRLAERLQGFILDHVEGLAMVLVGAEFVQCDDPDSDIIGYYETETVRFVIN